MGAIHLVRHGQASFGTGHYDQLSELGHEQARLVGEDMASRGLVPDVIIHGGLQRQRETAEGLRNGLFSVLGAGSDTPGRECPTELDDRWQEYDADTVLRGAQDAGLGSDHGSLDTAGTSEEAKRAFQRELDVALEFWTTQPSFAEYRANTEAALRSAAELAGSGRTVVVVSSAGTISLAVAGLLADSSGVAGLWSRLQRVTVNTGTARVVVGRGGMTCISVNEQQHLERAAGPENPRRLITLR